MRVLLLVVVWLIGTLTLAFAQTEVACLPPNFTCPQCIVTCAEIPACPACPDVTLSCAQDSGGMPGLWQVRFKGTMKCGTVTRYGDWAVIEDQLKNRTWLLVEKKVVMEAVESCD